MSPKESKRSVITGIAVEMIPSSRKTQNEDRAIAAHTIRFFNADASAGGDFSSSDSGGDLLSAMLTWSSFIFFIAWKSAVSRLCAAGSAMIERREIDSGKDNVCEE